ncbi:hypothetical protein SNE40_006196 [Patella caerulea]|uniref:DUF229 domain containing protein n=1 Tax=Patella caerulea TaxID=87958 RepID=A0AAN8K0Y9_PATCE
MVYILNLYDLAKQCIIWFLKKRNRLFFIIFVGFLATIILYNLIIVHTGINEKRGSNLDEGAKPISTEDEQVYTHILNEYFSNKDHSTEVLHRKQPRIDSKTACVHPKLDPYHPSLAKYFYSIPKLQCSKEENWVYVDNGTFYISKNIQKLYGDITCDIYPLVFQDDFHTIEGECIKNIKNGTLLLSDFFRAECKSHQGHSYTNRHMGVAFNPKMLSRLDESKQQHKRIDLNVFTFGLDSVSRMTSIRKLPKSRDYFYKILKGIELENYNIVGDGTVRLLAPMLTGRLFEELPDVRKGFGEATTFDETLFIWKDFKQAGYVTLWGDDLPGLGCFQFKLKGFNRPPTDHYLRPFYVAADLELDYGVMPLLRSYLHSFLNLFMKNPPINPPYCYGSKPKHIYFMEYLKDMFKVYGSTRKFMFGFHGEISHENNNNIEYMDEDIVELFQYLESSGYLNDTLLIFMSDHGARFGKFRSTVQGKQEERMPLFGFRFPSWFERVYPEVIRNFKINAHRLTTPLDIHATLKEILNFTGTGIGNISKRGISLFKEIPKERTCRQAALSTHWCACLDWQPVGQSRVLIRVIHTVISKLNELTSDMRNKCALLRIKQVLKILKYGPHSDQMNHYSASNLKIISYHVDMTTEPGNGYFESTVQHDLQKDVLTLDEKDISRANAYGTQPRCITQNRPDLLKYCHCS